MAEHQAEALPSLQVVEGRANKNLLPLDRPRLRIGRSSRSDLVLDDAEVSRAHAEISFQDGRYVVTDLQSRNGVYLDTARITQAPLVSGSRLRLGGTVLSFVHDLPAVSEAERLALLDRSDLLQPLPPETKAAISKALLVRVFPRDSLVRAQGAPIESMLFVVSGGVRIVELNEEGGERPVGQLGPGDLFGEQALLPGQSGSCALVANDVVVALELPQVKLSELLKTRPAQAATVVLAARDLLKSTGVEAAKDQQKAGPGAETTPAVGARRYGFNHLAKSTEVRILGEDKRVQAAKKKVETLAREGKPLLLVGPGGAGKRTFARHWHQHSPQVSEPYVEVSLVEIEAGAVEAALFGVEGDERAAHMSGQIGYLEMLGGGTLAIVHAERLDAHQQSKLATYMKLGWFHRLYGQMSVSAKTRVVLVAEGDEGAVAAALHPELKALLEGRVVALPPLSSRLKDIPILAQHFLEVHAKREGKRFASVSREAQDALVSYAWPGNVPELENVIQRAVIVAAEGESLPADSIIVVRSKQAAVKVNLLRHNGLRSLLRRRWVLGAFTWVNIVFVAMVVVLTLAGGVLQFLVPGHALSTFEHNFGMLVTWLVWFPLLPVTAVLLGRVWCGICPIIGIGDLAAKLVKLNLQVPRLLKRLDFWSVALAFLILDYVEDLAGVPELPLATATLLVVIIGAAVLVSVVFERKAFCRYLCPLSGLLGTYATMSLLEIRGNKKVCQTQCGQHTCFKGTSRLDGCPLGSYPASISTSFECMMCANCIRSCDNRGVQLNLRPPLSEMWHRSQPMLAMSLFAVALIGVMAQHQFSGLGFWAGIEPSLGLPAFATHTLLFAGFLLLALIPFVLSSTLSAAASQESLGRNMALYGLAFIPLAFSGHLAHVAHEFLSEGLYTLLSFFVGLFALVVHGTSLAQTTGLAPFIHPVAVTLLKVLVVLSGLVGSAVALVMVARKAAPHAVFARILPHAALLLFFWLSYTVIFVAPMAAEPAPDATVTPAAEVASPAPEPAPASPTAPRPAASRRPAATR